MSATLTVDVSQMRAALVSYSAATKKDTAYSLNRAGKNIAYQAIKEVKLGDRGVFQRLADYEPLLGWKIMQLKREGRLPRLGAGRSKQIARNNLMAVATPIDPYREYAQRLIKARRGRVGFIRGFFLRIAKQMESIVPGASAKGGAKTVQEIVPSISAATPGRLTLTMGSQYAYKRTNEAGRQQDSGYVDRMLNDAIEPAIGKVAADMIAYTEKVLSQNAARISAAGARSGAALAG